MQVEMLEDSRMRLLEELTFSVSSVPGVLIEVHVPKGYVTDGATIPRCLWWLAGQPTEGHALKAAVIHDWFCDQAKTYRIRRLGDTLFLHIMEESSVPQWRRILLFIAVRLYALYFWKPQQ